MDRTEFSKIEPKRISIASVITLVISIIFIFWGGAIHAKLANYPNTLGKLNVLEYEVSPSWQYTFNLAKYALKENLLLGAGPNRFVKEWLNHKPIEVNNGIFWNVDFQYGIGLIPTFIVTTGLLGIISFVIFLLAFLYAGFKAIFSPAKDIFLRYLLISSFFAALYLWIFDIIYIPGQVIFSLSFLFTGVFIAALYQEGLIKFKEINYGKNPAVNFAAILILIIILIASASTAYLFSNRLLSINYLDKALASVNTKGDINAGEMYLDKAINFNENDEYYRIKTQMEILKMSAILNQKGVSAADLSKQFQPVLADAIDSAQRAINIDQNNYQNWINIAQIYEDVLPLGYPGAYDNARRSYEKAASLNPYNPSIVLSQARLEALNKNYTAAISFIRQSLYLKPNYTEAVYLAAQIEISQGHTKDAINSVEIIAANIAPNDPTVFFELGFLKYSAKDYKGAIQALLRAVDLNSQYSNARYFLGLSYAKIGNLTNAISQFTEIEKYNPDNKEIKSILANLREGKDPLANSKKVKPEKRKKLPVKDQTIDANTNNPSTTEQNPGIDQTDTSI